MDYEITRKDKILTVIAVILFIIGSCVWKLLIRDKPEWQFFGYKLLITICKNMTESEVKDERIS